MILIEQAVSDSQAPRQKPSRPRPPQGSGEKEAEDGVSEKVRRFVPPPGKRDIVTGTARGEPDHTHGAEGQKKVAAVHGRAVPDHRAY